MQFYNLLTTDLGSINTFKFNPNVGVSSVQTGTYYPFANAIKFGSVINRSTQISFMYI